MSTANELLESYATESDNTLVINNDLRIISIPSSIKCLGVESDKDVTKLNFIMPRMNGEIDLSNFSIRINYLNSKGEGDIYIVNDATTDDDNITFSWLVGRNALMYKGTVKFIVCLKQYNENDEIEKEYNTSVASLPVLEGIEVDQLIIDQNPSVIEDILYRLDNTEASIITDYDLLDNKPITRLTGTDDDPIILGDLSAGIYMIKGKYKPTSSYSGPIMFVPSEGQALTNVTIIGASHRTVQMDLISAIRIYAFSGSDYVEKQIMLTNLATLADIENLEASIITDYDLLDNKPITRLTGTDDDPIVLRSLTSGSYQLKGNYKPISDYSGSMTASLEVMMNVVNTGGGATMVQMYLPYGNEIRYYQMTDSEYATNSVMLNNMATLTDLENLETSKLDISTASNTYAKISDLNATKTDIENLEASISETFSTVKNGIALNRTTLGTQCKNLLDWKNAAYSTSLRLTQTKTESGISVTSTGSWAVTAYKLPILEVGTNYIFSTTISNFSVQGGNANIIISTSTSSSNIVKVVEITSNGTATIKFEATSDTMYVLFFPNYSDTVYTNSFTASDIMLRYANITDDTYEPYKESVDERLIKNKSDIAVSKTTFGVQCKNLFNPNAVNWYRPTKTSIAKDGTITSTVTSDSRPWGIENAEYFLTLPAGKYIVKTVTETIDNTASNNENIRGYNERGAQLFDIYPNNIGMKTKSFTLTETATIAIMFKLFTQTCKIMIRDADITDDTYEPYKESVDERITNLEASIITDYDLLDNKPITRLTGTDDDPIILGNLSTGLYMLNGKFKPNSNYSGSNMSTPYGAETLINVATINSSVSAIQMYSPIINGIEYYQIMGSDYISYNVRFQFLKDLANGKFTIGSTTITEAQLKKILALIA